MKQYYAHTKNDDSGNALPMCEWQPLAEHLKNAAEMAAGFAEEFKSADFARIAGLLHDIGKGSDNFQAYLCREAEISEHGYSPNGHGHSHSAAGAYYAKEHLKPFGLIFSYIIAGHHAGLPDYTSADAANLIARLQSGKTELENINGFGLDSIKIPDNPKIRIKFDIDKFHFWIRMLFSCLVDADRLDTERFVSPENYKLRQNYPSIDELHRLFEEKMSDFVKKSGKSDVNSIRSEIREHCIKASKEKPGIYSLSVPTGGGKTLSGTEFALKHCLKHSKKRIIYVIPYTSIIEQTAKILKNYFGKENVIEHHSNADLSEISQAAKLSAENWDAPIIVTTNVQFFESLFAASPSKCRKLHNIANSVVILDEAQLLPPELLDSCQKAIKELSENYGVTFLISTATQPVLKDIGISHEIIPKEAGLNHRLKRVSYSIKEKQTFEDLSAEIKEKLKNGKQVLCIVNRKKDAAELHNLIPGSYHLSASMCAEHRSDVIGKIKDMLKRKEQVCLISTQLIEAGVDIDFPVVYRAMSGIDSIKQAAGRCNREGKIKEGEVIVFIPPKPAPAGILSKAENASKTIFSGSFDMFSAETDFKYFEIFYSRIDQRYDYKSYFCTGAAQGHFQFRSGADNFRLIKDSSIPVFIHYGQSSELIEELRRRIKNGIPFSDLLRKLQRYIVNIDRKMIENKDSTAEKITEGIYVWNGSYSDDTGLISENISFNDLCF